MVDLRHLQSLAQVALLQLIDALDEAFPLSIGQRVAKHNTDVVRHAEIRLDRRRPADHAFRFERSDAREVRHAHADRRIHDQRLVMDEAESAAADVDESNLTVVFEPAVIAGQLYLDGYRDRHADEVAQLNALGALRQIEIPDRIRQL